MGRIEGWLWFQGCRERCNVRAKASLFTLKVFQQKIRAGRVRRALCPEFTSGLFLFFNKKEKYFEIILALTQGNITLDIGFKTPEKLKMIG